MKLIIYTEGDKTICKVKPKELLEFSFEDCTFVEVEENLVEVER